MLTEWMGGFQVYKFIEELSLQSWPALAQIELGGWLLRFAEGYTKRSNSVNPLYVGSKADAQNIADTQDIADKIKRCEQYYHQAGLPTVFKITPYIEPSNLDAVLQGRGYTQTDLSRVQSMDLAGLAPLSLLKTRDSHSQCLDAAECQVTILKELNPLWLETVGRLSGLSEAHGEVKQRLLRYSGLNAGYVLLHEEGVPVACGLGVVTGGGLGIYEIGTDSAFRRRGYARQLLLHLLEWGTAQGAQFAYLQVLADNKPALQLYEGLGFQDRYSYWYRVQPGT
ncbi:putative acetyltransferase [compost metagenome]